MSICIKEPTIDDWSSVAFAIQWRLWRSSAVALRPIATADAIDDGEAIVARKTRVGLRARWVLRSFGTCGPLAVSMSHICLDLWLCLECHYYYSITSFRKKMLTNTSTPYFIHSFILEMYIAPLQETTTQRGASSPVLAKVERPWKCKIWKGRPSWRCLICYCCCFCCPLFTRGINCLLDVTYM